MKLCDITFSGPCFLRHIMLSDGRWLCQDRGRILLRESTGRLDLEFKKLRPVDSGNYSCTSENQAGSHSAVGAVVVNCT